MFAAPGTEPRPWEPRRERDGDDQLHLRHDRAPQGRAAHAPQPLDERGDLRPRTPGVTDRDVYLHTLPMFHCNGWGMPFAMTGLGVPHVVLRKVDGAEILRRVERARRDGPVRAPRPWSAAVLDAAADWEGEIPGRDRVRIIVAGAPPPTKTIERVEAELGWEFIQIYGLTETSPLLTVNRHRRGVGRPGARGRAPRKLVARRRACRRRTPAHRTTRARCWRGPTSSSRATGSTPTRPSGPWSTGGSTPATAASSATTATSRSATARRT